MLGRFTKVLIALALVASAGVAPARAAFRGGNGSVALISQFAERGGERSTALLSYHGKGRVKTLVQCTSNEFDAMPANEPCPSAPAWSPDGRRIAFGFGDRIALAGPDGSNRTLLPAASASDGEPAFSPEGSRLVFTATAATGEKNLFVVGTDGTGLRQLTTGGGSEASWSTRDRIAYVRGRTVRVVAPDGKEDRRVASGTAPDWSPSGRTLVYALKGRVYTLSTRAGARRRRLVRRRAFDPVFAPDSRRIAFVREGSFVRSLLQDLPLRRGKARTLLDYGDDGTASASNFADPAWQPRLGSRSGGG